MSVAVHLFFCVLIAVACGLNFDEENGLEPGQSTSEIPVQETPSQEAPHFTNIKRMPRIYVKPTGNMIILKCKAAGNPTPNVTWYKNDEVPKRHLGGNISYRQWSLTIEDLDINDSGIYRCVVCNSLGCINFNYTVDVVERIHSRPILTDPPQNKTVAVGSNANFSCTFISDLQCHVYWVIGIPGENGTVKAKSASEDPSILELVNVTYDSEGWYTCVVANALGVTTSSAYLKVVGEPGHPTSEIPVSEIRSQEAPHFTNITKMARFHVKPAGNIITLKCKAAGNPTPNVTWYKNDEVPKRHLGKIRYGQWSLTVEDLVIDDSGIYRCVVCNSLGCINFNYTVDVVERYHNRPILTDPPQNKTVVVGSNVNFSCTFVSDLNPHVYWVTGSSGENGTVKVKGAYESPSILELVNVTHDSEGWYTCVVGNSLGVTSSRAYLKVVEDTSH